MSLPKMLKSARMSNATLASAIDDNTNAFEQDLADILGIPIDTNLPIPLAGALYSEIADANTIANTTTDTAFTKNYTLPANSLVVGSVLRFLVGGTLAFTASPTLNLRLKIAGTTFLTLTPGLTAGSGVFSAELIGTVRSIGAGGSIYGVSSWGLFAGNFAWSAEATPALDTTVTRLLELWAQWGTANPGNTITLKEFSVEHLRAFSTS